MVGFSSNPHSSLEAKSSGFFGGGGVGVGIWERWKPIGVLFGCFGRKIDADSGFTWWSNHLPGPSNSPKRAPMSNPHSSLELCERVATCRLEIWRVLIKEDHLHRLELLILGMGCTIVRNHSLEADVNIDIADRCTRHDLVHPNCPCVGCLAEAFTLCTLYILPQIQI